MEVGRVGRLSTSGRSEAESLCPTPYRGKHNLKSNEEQQNYQKQQQQQHPKATQKSSALKKKLKII